MDVEQVITEARALITKAAQAHDSGDALRFSQAAYNATNALRCAMDSAAQTPPPSGLSDGQIKHMVSRFLHWKLPENFHPDAGINFKAEFNEHTEWPGKHQPVGTNLFDATQAEAMVRHMIEGMPQLTESPAGP